MKKKFLALTLALSTFVSCAYAEQPKAAEYRQILESGKFMVEYDMDSVTKCLAAENGKRMDYTVIKSGGNMALGMGLALINPVLAVAALFVKNENKTPSNMYQDGKYYQFKDKKTGIMAKWNELTDENLDPEENWEGIKFRLALPEEFAALSTNDPFYQELYGGLKPTFTESGVVSIEGKDYDYDRYEVPSYSASGSVLFNKYYYLCYMKGELKMMQTYMGHSSSDEVLVKSLKIKKFTGELPEKILEIPNGYKIYAAGLGDMDDLLDNLVLVESYERKDNDDTTTSATEEEEE